MVIADTTTIVSSTIKPNAIKKAKSDKKLIDIPVSCINIKAERKVSGTVKDEMTAWRKPKNKSKAVKTKIIVERNSWSKSVN